MGVPNQPESDLHYIACKTCGVNSLLAWDAKTRMYVVLCENCKTFSTLDSIKPWRGLKVDEPS